MQEAAVGGVATATVVKQEHGISWLPNNGSAVRASSEVVLCYTHVQVKEGKNGVTAAVNLKTFYVFV